MPQTNPPQYAISNTYDPEPSARASALFSQTLWEPQNQIAAQESHRDALANSAFTRAQQAALNLQNIQKSRADIELQKGLLDVERQKQKTALEEAKLKGGVSQWAIKRLEEDHKAKTKPIEEQLKAASVLNDAAEHEHHSVLKDAVGTLQVIGQSQYQSPYQDQSFADPMTFNNRPMALADKRYSSNPAQMSDVQAFGGGAKAYTPPTIPMNGEYKPDQADRYEPDLGKMASTGAVDIKESDAWKAKEKNQVTLGLKEEQNAQKYFKLMGDDLDPSKQVRSAFGISKQIFDRAERLESLATSLPDGNLDSRQIEELAIGLNAMLSGSNTGAQRQVEALVPKSIWGNAMKLKEWLANEPTGLNQQKFVERLLGTIQREKDTAAAQIKRTQFMRVAKYRGLEKIDKEGFDMVLLSNGIDPLEYEQWKEGGYKQTSAVQSPEGSVRKIGEGTKDYKQTSKGTKWSIISE